MCLECSAAMGASEARPPHPVDETQSDESHPKDDASEDYRVRVDDEDEIVNVDHLDRPANIVFDVWRVTWGRGRLHGPYSYSAAINLPGKTPGKKEQSLRRQFRV